MNIGLNLLWGLDLDDQVNIRDVESTGGDISGDQHLEFSFLKSLHRDFTLVLNDVTVHHFDVLLDFVSQNKSVRVSLGLSEHDSFACATVANEDVSEG